MKKVYLLLCIVFCSVNVFCQNYQSFNASGGLIWTGANWSASSPTNACVTTGLTNAFTAGRIVYLCTPVGTGTGAVGISMGGIIATEDYTHSTPSGTLATGGTVVTLDVASGKTVDMSTAAFSTAAGTGFIKANSGVFALAGGTYAGGFTLNAGTIIVRGVNAMGSGGALTINGGIIAANATRDLTGKYAGGITVGGDFTLGATTGLALSGANLTFSNTMALGAAASRKITIGGTGTYTLNGVISGAGSSLIVDSIATIIGTLSFGGVNTYSGGTTLKGGTLQMAVAGALPTTGDLTFNGGTLKTGAAAGFSQTTSGILSLTENSTLRFGTGAHSLTLANSSAVGWTGGKMLTITGWAGAYNGTAGTAGRLFVGTDATGVTAGQLAQIQFFNGTTNFPASILSTGEIVAGVVGGTPDILLSSPSPAVAAGNMAQGSTNNVIYRFDLAVTTSAATLTGVTITTAGTYAATDITNFKCWYSADAIFNSASDVLLSTNAAPAVAGAQVFPSFTSQVIASGNTGYIFITANIPCAAALTNINVTAIGIADLTFSGTNNVTSGGTFDGGLQTIILATPNDVTVPVASVANTSSSVSWTTPAGCHDAILIVARAGFANDGIPTGDGTAYTGNLIFGSGTALGSGFVVYNGASISPQVVTNLVNGTQYFYKFFTRKGTNWSAGVEVSATPAVVTAPTDYFRSVAPGGDWGAIATWESSPDNATWMAATLVPTSAANTITIQNGANVTVNAVAGGDQIVVNAGAILTFNANFTLADGTGTDLDVFGTVINTNGAHSFTGTANFHPGTLYQHNRNGGPVPTATWDVTSTLEVTGATSAAPTNITQTLGNFTWNSNTTTTTNLVGTLTTVAGNFRVQNSGTAALRLTGSADLNLTVNGNFTVEDDLDIDNNATGVCNISIGGNFVHTGGVFQSSVDVATITMTGASKTFTQSGGTFTSTNLNWIIFGGASITLLNDIPVSVTRSILVTGTLDASTLQITGAGDITVNGILRSAHANGLEATGTLANSGTNTLGVASTIDYYAAIPQIFSNRTDYVNVLVNGGGTKTLNGNATVNNVLTFTNGLVVSTAANLLTFANTASASGASNTSFVSGPVRKIGNTLFEFPIGKSGTGLVPFAVSNFTGTLDPNNDAFTAEYIRLSAYSVSAVITDPLIDHVSSCDYWVLDKTSGAQTADITATWNSNNQCNGTPYVDDLTKLAIVHYNGASWNTSSVGFASTTGGPAAGTITWPNVTTYSPFSLGSTSYGANPLPIIINYFTGSKQNGNHLLNWKVTNSSTTNTTMEMLRSTDGRTYTAIYSINATAVQCQQPFSYADIQPAKGVNYYRLKMTDATGKITYSNIVSLINADKGFDVMNIAPNPIMNGRFNLDVSAAQKANMEIVITDMQGRVMQKNSVSMIAGFNTIPVNVSNFAKGTYQVYGYTAEGRSKVLRFVIQ